MRVIAGSARSLPLKAPEGPNTRPTTDRIKETLFNMLMPYIPGAVFVDAFSGSGAIGIEAISRGASKVYFIENNTQALKCIDANIKFTHFSDNAIVIKQDVLAALSLISEKHVDVFFMDPPYDNDHEKRVLSVLKDMKYIDEDSLIVVEASLKTDFDYLQELGFEMIKEKKYKTNKHVYIKRC